MNLNEAFRALNALNEDTFSVSDDGIAKLADFRDNDDYEDEIKVIDVDAETEDDLQDSYVGKVILDCCVCHSKLYKDKAEIELNDDETFANVGEECPFCYTSDGFKVVGEVAAFGGVADNDGAEDVEDGNDTVEESLTEPTTKDDIKDEKSEPKNEPLTEEVNNVNVETDDSIVNVSTEGDGKVTVTTEPKTPDTADGDEVIVPVTDETQSEIETPVEGEEMVDGEFDDFDEESFDELGESYLKEIYENVDSYKTTDVSSDIDHLFVEGVIKFTSGAEKKTSFIFEAKDCTKTGKYRLIGENKQLTAGKKAFTIAGKINEGKFITESFNYNYRTRDNQGKLSRVYGTKKR